MQRPPASSAASSTTNRLPAAASRRPAAMPAAPAPTTTASTQPERGTSGTGAGRGAANAGPATAAMAEDARKDRRVKRRMGAATYCALLSWNACPARLKYSSSSSSLRYRNSDAAFERHLWTARFLVRHAALAQPEGRG